MKAANQTRFTTTLVLRLMMLLTLAFIAATGALPLRAAHANTIIVDSYKASDLINAINTANGNGKDDTIILKAGSTHALTTADAPDPEGDGPDGGDIYDVEIAITKTANPTTAQVGETIIYTYQIENRGAITLTSISANDDKLGAVAGISTTLLPGEVTTGVLTHIVADADLHGPLVNMVTVTGTSTDGLVVTDSASASVALLEYCLTTNTTGTGSGTVTKTPDLVKYQYGDVVTLMAQSAPGSTFTGWSGDITGTDNPITITMDGDKTATANFNLIEYTLTVNTTGTGSGPVTKTPDQPTYHYGDVAALTATANAGSTFTGWSGDLTGTTSPTTITIDGDKTVTAAFDLIEYTLTINKVGSGSVSKELDQATYHYGDVVTLTATPVIGWQFAGWSGNLSGSENPKPIVINGHKTVTANFIRNAYALTVGVVGSGSVTRSPDQAAYIHGTMVTLTANANPGWTFAGWSGTLSGAANPATLTMDGSKVVTATFTQVGYTLNVNIISSQGGSVTKQPDKPTYTYNEVVTLTATANPYWNFAGWSGDIVATTHLVTIIMNDNKTVTATLRQYRIYLPVTLRDYSAP